MQSCIMASNIIKGKLTKKALFTTFLMQQLIYNSNMLGQRELNPLPRPQFSTNIGKIITSLQRNSVSEILRGSINRA